MLIPLRTTLALVPDSSFHINHNGSYTGCCSVCNQFSDNNTFYSAVELENDICTTIVCQNIICQLIMQNSIVDLSKFQLDVDTSFTIVEIDFDTLTKFVQGK